MLKEIGTRARHDIEKMLGRHVRLHLFVRVQKNGDDPRTVEMSWELRNSLYHH
ncbi:MAG: hypothetical protein U0Y68_10710 [Blastocatellia bacterium]